MSTGWQNRNGPQYSSPTALQEPLGDNNQKRFDNAKPFTLRDPFNVSLTCRNMYQRYFRTDPTPTRCDDKKSEPNESHRTERSISANTTLATSSDSVVDGVLDSLKKLSVSSTKVELPRPPSGRRRHYWRREILQARRQALLEEISGESFDDLYAKTEIPKPKPSLQPLNDEENEFVDAILRPNQSGLISQLKSSTVEYKDVYTLTPNRWLNDEVINAYMDLITMRAETDGQLPKLHCFSTFFCSTLRERGYDGVKRWTKRVDIFDKDLILIPIHHAHHWTLGVVDIKGKQVEVYDSLGGDHQYTTQLLLEYLQKEHLNKKQTALPDVLEWTIHVPKDIPHQNNMSDCGVFTCVFAERRSQKRLFDFSHQDMPLIRRRMILDIIHKNITI